MEEEAIMKIDVNNYTAETVTDPCSQWTTNEFLHSG